MKHYLDFNGVDDYIFHLKSKGVSTTKLDMEVETTKGDKWGIFTVMWYAVATQRVEDYVARDKTMIKRMLNMDMTSDDYKAREDKTEPAYKIDGRARLAKAKEYFENHGITVEPGIWKES